MELAKKRTNGPFMQDLENLLTATAPRTILIGVGVGAVASGGSWAKFFSESLPHWLGLISLVWAGLGLFYALYRKCTGEFPHIVVSSGGDEENLGVNPTTGLPLISPGMDSGGNTYGS